MRCTPLLLLALACTHTQTQPPPAPLAVPPENASGPAGLPDAGEGGPVVAEALVDGGVVDGGPADAGPADAGAVDGGIGRGDLVSPITAAGSETPVGLDWGPKGDQLASTLFKNVKLLRGLTGNRFMAGMQSMKANLGVKCAFCHLVAEKDFPSDQRKEKLKARQMIKMNEEINRRTFKGEVRVTCWTCHRGEEEPKGRPFAREIPEELSKLTADQLKQPAEKVFKDVQQLKGMDARNFAYIMGWFERELGVECKHCHDVKDYAADTAKKTRAREMLEMTGYIGSRYYNNDSPVTCGTCHKGKAVPPKTPGDKS